MDKKNQVRQGEVLLLILVAVNVIEFWLATRISSYVVNLWSMMLLAAIDVGLILLYYMHMLRVFDEDKGGH